MEQKTLTARLRTHFGTADSRRQRRNGKIPAVIYGHTEPKGLIIDAHEFNTKFMTISESTIINLQVDGDSYDVLMSKPLTEAGFREVYGPRFHAASTDYF